jgi:hypothetical protein
MTGKYAGLLLVIVLLLAIFMPLAGAQGEGSVTRSQTFTVTIAGTPYANYYVWLAGTFSLSGAPGEQPPVVVANQENVVQDPPGGPYTIGSYKYYNGGGRTILDDVAPSTATVSDTSYYAEVTTDQNGLATIAFSTSRETAAQSFSVVAQNPANPSQNVAVSLGTPTQVTAEEVTPFPRGTLQTFIPTTVPSLPVVNTTVVVTPTLSPANVPLTTPTTASPVNVILVIASVGIAFLVMVRKRR